MRLIKLFTEIKFNGWKRTSGGLNTGQWIHFELDYTANLLRFFANGVLRLYPDWGVYRAGRIITFGGLSAAFRNFRILDGVCLHTENFTPPAWSEDYELTDETISLLNF